MTTLAALKAPEKSNTRDSKIILGRGTILITGRQIRMARAALGWSGHDLADRVKLGYAAIQRAEATEGMPSMHTHNLLAIKTTFEKAGIIFIDGGDYSGRGGPGVRLRK